ncbi:hypothetical protein H0W26_02180 [Candidatus Dependentiae bacterium]|nr:hypothetical protein [Candidatus Dependentiae bacterium]
MEPSKDGVPPEYLLNFFKTEWSLSDTAQEIIELIFYLFMISHEMDDPTLCSVRQALSLEKKKAEEQVILDVSLSICSFIGDFMLQLNRREDLISEPLKEHQLS